MDLQTLFGKPVSYRISQFQRRYAWRRDEQWEPLWDDVVNIAEHWLSRKSGHKMHPHLMRAIVLQRQDNSAEIAKRLVVDGQQRLTTLQLLMRKFWEYHRIFSPGASFRLTLPLLGAKCMPSTTCPSLTVS